MYISYKCMTEITDQSEFIIISDTFIILLNMK